MNANLIVSILFLLFFGGIILTIIALIGKTKRTKEIQKILNTRVFLVSIPKEAAQPESGQEPPKDYRQVISVAEQMFAAIGSIYSGAISNKILNEQQQVSFEIVASEGLISFYVACPKMLEEMIEKQIHAYYPNAHIEPVKNHNIFKTTNTNSQVASAELELNKRFILPIRTYLNLESESLSAITNSLSKLGEGNAAAIQYIIKPAGEEWRRNSQYQAKRIQEGKTYVTRDEWYYQGARGAGNFAGDIIGQAMSPGSIQNRTPEHALPMQGSKGYTPITPIQEAMMKAINDKISKPGFEVKIRLVAVAQDKMSAQTDLQVIASSFAQFTTPQANGFKIKNGTSDMVKDFILRRFNEKGIILNTEELASIFHFPNHFIQTPNIRWLMAKEMPPPANAPQEGVIMGNSVYRGIETLIRIKPGDRQKHVFMIGKTGTGKTTLFTNMMEQDIAEGRGCCFVDPLGDAIEDMMGKIPPHRYQDVIIFDAADTEYPMGLNMLEYRNVEQRDFLIQECIEIFYKLFDPNRTGMVGPQWEHWFRNAALTVMSQPGGGTLIDIPRIFTDDTFRKSLMSYITDPLVKSFWDEQLAKTADFHKSEMYNYFISKFGRFMTNDLMRNIIGQKKSAFDFREAMDSGKILLINLSKGKIGEINSNLLGMILVAKIQMSAFSRADIPEEQRRDFYLYVDEFQNFTTDNFRTILSEARKYHLDLNITTQYIAQLTESIRDAVVGNAGTMILYRIGAADAEFMQKEFPGVAVSDMTNLDRFNTYVKLLIDGTPSKPFSMKGIKSPVEARQDIRDYVKSLSRQTFSRHKSQVEQEFQQTLQIGHAPAGMNEPLRNL
jgi:hypothetical protein